MKSTEVFAISGLAIILAVVVVLRANQTHAQPARSGGSSSGQHATAGKPVQAGGIMYSSKHYDITPLSKERIAQLAKGLTDEERNVLLSQGTERPFCGTLLDNKKEGVYTCRLCGLPLFSSAAKFHSGTGWPSFYRPADPAHIHEERDKSLGMVRVEIQCARCRGHLGHVFDDGPKPTGLRYCLNSASLKFHDKDAELPPESRPVEFATAYFAGGCFWGVEDRFQGIPGVIDAVSGYQGGTVEKPTYKLVCGGRSGHAEAVRVTYDPQRVSYRELLEWFFKMHNPTTLNRQGPDVGSQYRSAIFADDEAQLKEARAYIAELQKTDAYKSRKIVTQVQPADTFYEAEEYHQDYHAKHGGSCALP